MMSEMLDKGRIPQSNKGNPGRQIKQQKNLLFLSYFLKTKSWIYHLMNKTIISPLRILITITLDLYPVQYGKKKEVEDIKSEKEELKLSLLTNSMIVYIQNSHIYRHKIYN